MSSRPRGYTIVEVMIFLAVTGGLFAAVVITFSGRQGRTQFTAAAREMESRMQDIINDVSTGYYSNPGDVRCRESGGAPQIFSSGGNAQGTSQDCIFIGRVAHFNVSGSSGEAYKVYTVAGLRQTGPATSPRDVENFAEARPRSSPLLVDTERMPGGLSVARVSYGGGDIDGVGFFSSFGSRDASTGELEPGSLSINVVPLGNPSASTEADMLGAISAITGSNQNPSGGVRICMNSSTSDQHAILTVGGSDRRLATDLTINNGACA